MKEDEQIEREKKAIKAMRNAVKNMETSFDRISTLERALKSLINDFEAALKYMPTEAYLYDSTTNCKKAALNAISTAKGVL